MNIEKIKYQYAVPNKKYTPTRNPNYHIDTKWYEYFYAKFENTYCTEDELEFLKALKQDLEQELTQVDKDIKKLQKTF